MNTRILGKAITCGLCCNPICRRLNATMLLFSTCVGAYVLVSDDWATGMQVHLFGSILLLGSFIVLWPLLLTRVDVYAIISFLLWLDIGFVKHSIALDAAIVRSDTLVALTMISLLSFCFTLIGLLVLIPSRTITLPREFLSREILLRAAVACFVISGPSLMAKFVLGVSLPLIGSYLALFVLPGAVFAACALFMQFDLFSAVLFLGLCSLVVANSSRRITAVLGTACFFLWLDREFQRRKNPRGVVFLCLLCALMAYLGLSARRSIGWSGGTFAGFLEDYRENVLGGRNLSTVPSFALAYETFPAQEPFLRGSTIVNLVLNPIPRAIWPDKPISMSKVAAFRKHGFRGPIAYTRDAEQDIASSSFSVTFPGEMWANFGWLGVALGSFVLGITYRFLESMAMANGLRHFRPLVIGSLIAAVIIQNRGDLLAANKHSITVIVAGTLILVCTNLFHKIIRPHT